MVRQQNWKQIQRHYGDRDIAQRIIDRLHEAGYDLDNLSRDDTSSFDEFHGGGRTSTLALAKFAGFSSGLHVLDLGSGVGGPARSLAAEYACIVTGLELTGEFVRAGKMLTDLLGLSTEVDFVQASATEIPFKAEVFDIVWSQNMLMNVSDKEQLFREAFRVTKPGGKFAFETVVAGSSGAPHYPTFWATDPNMNFLVSAKEMQTLGIGAGFREVSFKDNTDDVIANGRRRLQVAKAGGVAELDLSVIVTTEVAEKMENSVCNNIEGRTGAVQALFQRPG